MGRLGVSIVKSTTFRGAAQHFANTYYYNFAINASAAIADDIISLIVTKEKTMHGNQVNFVLARAWSAGGTKAENEQLAQTNLSGTGSGGTPPQSLDKERAFLVRFRAGNDSRGRPVYLRKWWHLNVGTLGTALTDPQLGNTAPLDTVQRGNLVGYGDFFKFLAPTALSAVGNAELVSENGRGITGATVAHPYLEHRQLGDMWR